MNLERVGGIEDGQGNGSKGETTAEELRVEDTAAYNQMLRMNCKAFEEILTALGPAITKRADRKPIMDAWSNEKNYHRSSSTIIDYHVPFDQGLSSKNLKLNHLQDQDLR